MACWGGHECAFQTRLEGCQGRPGLYTPHAKTSQNQKEPERAPVAGGVLAPEGEDHTVADGRELRKSQCARGSHAQGVDATYSHLWAGRGTGLTTLDSPRSGRRAGRVRGGRVGGTWALPHVCDP